MNKRLIIRALITVVVLGMVVYIIRLLFFYKPSPEYKDILNVIFGGVLAQLPTVINYWFKKDEEDQKVERMENQ